MREKHGQGSDCVEEDDEVMGRRDKVVVAPREYRSLSSTRMDACRSHDPEAAKLGNLRRKRSVFHLIVSFLLFLHFRDHVNQRDRFKNKMLIYTVHECKFIQLYAAVPRLELYKSNTKCIFD
jgi:hypothetical protein